LFPRHALLPNKIKHGRAILIQAYANDVEAFGMFCVVYVNDIG